jgi:hypothetical protein
VYGDMLQLMKGILLHYPEAAFPIRVL